ncbi:MAG: S8 family serine peptidase [Phycisphaerales bacterium]|nr:S8 family serine peptidase [Phycisphaerales bacterium]
MMTRMRMSSYVIGAIAACGAVVSSAAASDNRTGGQAQAVEFVERPGSLEFSGAMIARPVQNDAGKNAAARNLILNNFVVNKYIDLNDEYVFQLPEGVTENQAAQTLMATGNFEYIQPDWICYPQLNPNDPSRGSQWHHTKMESYAGWDVHTGNSSTRVGICDTGLRTAHEEFAQHRADGWNAVRSQWESQGGNVQDINGHGTHTSGCAAANGNNSRGGLGVGWSLGHRILRVSESSNGGANFSTLTSAAIKAAQSGDKCSSVSYSGADSASVRTTGTTVKNLGGLLFWAAGNESRNMPSPNRDADDVIIVGATTSNDVRASFSNYGVYVDLFAPGDNIFSTWNSHNSSYAILSGTSMACPIAAGVGAMIFSNNPGITPDQVEELLKNSCTDIGATGVDTIYGYGRVNLKNAMSGIGGPLTLAITPIPLNGGGQVTFNITDAAPSTDCAVYYSISGLGQTFVSELNVTLGIANPIRAGGIKTSDSNGNVNWNNLPVPSVPRRFYVWFQAAERNGRVSDIIDTWVDP